MADFNKIFIDSTLTVIPAKLASLCFNDNTLLSTNDYSIADNKINILKNSSDTLSIFITNGIATTYEFENIRLNTAGTILPKTDIDNKNVEGLIQNQVLVFVNGELQPTSAYTIVNDTTLEFTTRYTNDYDKYFHISLYVSCVPFERVTYTPQQITNITNNELLLSLVYNVDNTIVFVNDQKVPFTAIEDLSTEDTNKIRLNIQESPADIKSLEIIKLLNKDSNSSISSYNFNTTHGYTIYGPYDAYNKKLPNNYNLIFRFKDQAKLLIDNIRQGFIIKEIGSYGEAVITDNNFESYEIKGLQTQPFRKNSYTGKEYYFEVPEVISIVGYISKFDDKYTFLPEILAIYQKMLLNEVHDSIQRLRDARNIDRVDSTHINKLIKLLGFDANIKELNIKQRKELLAELTEFYRKVGTRESYNLVNILQNDLKLISAEQLFTPSGLSARKNKALYDYYKTIIDGGSGYKLGDVIMLNGTRLSAEVTEIDENNNNTITGIELQTNTGYENLNDEYPTSSQINGSLSVNSTPIEWSYTWTAHDDTNCHVGETLLDLSGDYSITVNSLQNGHIKTFTPHSTIHDVTNDTQNVDVKNRKLYHYTKDISFVVNYTANKSPSKTNYRLIKTITPGMEGNVSLGPGEYYIEASGGGGSGGASNSAWGDASHVNSGANGELKTLEFTLRDTTQFTFKVGQGGGKVRAPYSDDQPTSTQKGTGYEDGELGQKRHDLNAVHVHHGWHSHTEWQNAANAIGGQGGGSTAFIDEDGRVILLAKGGNGGSATSWYSSTKYNIEGGVGGSGGISIAAGGQGAKGSERAIGGDWNQDGQDGWIKIYMIQLTYNVDMTGDTSQVTDGETFTSTGSLVQFKAVASIIDGQLSFDITPKTGYTRDIGTYRAISDLGGDAYAELDISSTPINYLHTSSLSSSKTYLTEGTIFTVTDPEFGTTFTYNVTNVNKNSDAPIEGILTPDNTPDNINFDYMPADPNVGTGAIIKIQSEISSQRNEDRCYIDFYRKEELGAELKTEIRNDIIDYGTITEGTPGSPQWWVTGNPDENYGKITEGTPYSPDMEYSGLPDVDYGSITKSTAGEVVEWWEWDRDPIWYPTNHVDVEVKLPAGANFKEYVDTFVEQFYNIASTVVFIHQITESFYFGINSTGTSEEGKRVGDSLGIATGMPITAQEIIVTSDPSLQYINSNLLKCDLTIIPTPSNATVIVTQEVVENNQAKIKEIVRGTGTQTLTGITYGTELTYKVRANNYKTEGETFTIRHDTNKYVTLNHR